jgi:glycosyltransferase involved in cell wall biosynthesis
MPSEAIIIVPAFNEEKSIPFVLREIREKVPGLDIVVVSDGSADETVAIARREGACVLDLPCNLGVGEAVQTGFRYAFEQGYSYAVRCDGDGQHTPGEIPSLLLAIRENDVDLVIGSRFLGSQSFDSTFVRSFGIRGLAWFLSLICRKRITDPTSGFQALNRTLLCYFSREYPRDYPEPEALAVMRRQGYDFMEIPAAFRERRAGRSSIGGWDTLYYALKVFLALLVDRVRPVDVRNSAANIRRLV